MVWGGHLSAANFLKDKHSKRLYSQCTALMTSRCYDKARSWEATRQLGVRSTDYRPYEGGLPGLHSRGTETRAIQATTPSFVGGGVPPGEEPHKWVLGLPPTFDITGTRGKKKLSGKKKGFTKGQRFYTLFFYPKN